MMVQINAEEEDASLRMTANYYIYLVWILLTILIASLTTKVYLGEEPGPIIYLIIAIFTMIFVIFLYNKMKNVSISY